MKLSSTFQAHIVNSDKLRKRSKHLPFWRSYHLRYLRLHTQKLVRYKWHDCVWQYLYTFRHRCTNCHYGILNNNSVHCSLIKDIYIGIHASACHRYRGIKYQSPIVSIHPYSFYESLLLKAAPGTQLELF